MFGRGGIPLTIRLILTIMVATLWLGWRIHIGESRSLPTMDFQNGSPHGICISCAEITSEDYGSWSDEKDYSYDKNGRILASILVFLDRTEEELENAIYRTKNNSFAEQKKYRMKKKHLP